MKHFYFQSHRAAGERGMALLFTLGILSIILVIVMIFVSYSRSEQKTASAYSDMESAKYIAWTGVKQAVTAANKSENDLVVSKTLNVGGNGISGSGDCDWIWKIETPGLIDFGNSYQPSSSSDYPTWQYVRSDGKIIGRFAYYSVSDRKLNINAFAAHGDVYHIYCLNAAADSAFRTGNAKKCESTGETGSELMCKRRLGISTAELVFDNSQLVDAANISFIKKDSIDEMQLSPPDKTEPSWPDSASLLANYPGKVSTDPDVYNAQKYTLESFFDFDNVSKYEVFWGGYDSASKNKKTADQYYHRFNLRRDNWNTITVDDLLGTTKKLSEDLSVDDIKGDKTGGIPWLRNWKEGGAWGDSTAMQKQIAANIINYNAPETRPVVSDLSPSQWDSANSHPTYTGLKRTPYLNEVVVELKVALRVDEVPLLENGAPTGRSTYTVTLDGHTQLYTELVNMFQKPITGTYQPAVDGTVDLRIKFNTLGIAEDSAIQLGSGASLKNFVFSTWDFGNTYAQASQPYTSAEAKNGYIRSFDFQETYEKKFEAESNKKSVLEEAIRISPVVTLKRVWLKDTSKGGDAANVDYAALEYTEKQFGTNADDISLSTGTDHYLRLSFQTEDPRQNLKLSDWYKQTAVEDVVSNIHTVKTDMQINQKEGGSVSASDGENIDKELVKDPAWRGTKTNEHVSTAFIRHDMMRSFWELGAIHRAEKWRTLNLCASPVIDNTSDSSAFYNAGGGKYSDGDGAILDQVKLIRDIPYSTNLMSKVNISNYSNAKLRDFNYKTLFNGLTFKDGDYCNYDVLNSDGNDVNHDFGDVAIDDETQCKYLVEALVKASEASGTEKPERRTDLYRNDEFKNAFFKDDKFSRATNAMQEQIVGRTMNLMEVEQTASIMKIVVLAQSIRDVGGATVFVDWNKNGKTDNSVQTLTGEYNSGYLRDDDTAFKTTKTTIASQVTTEFGKYDNGGDAISGECKMLVTVKYDQKTSSWKIMKVENVE